MDPDERHDDFADDFAGDARPEQEQARGDSPDGGDKARANSQPSTPGGRNGRPTPAAIEERRVRDSLSETRGRASSSTIDPPRGVA
jgi:hypothetical protein